MLHPPTQSSEERARQAALDAGARYPRPRLARISYTSRGAVLVAGPASLALAASESLVKGLRVVVLSDGPTDEARVPPNVQVVPGRLATVTGHLGRFSVSAVGPAGPLDLGPLSPNRDERFDLVLDLGTEPCLKAQVRPLGYFASGGRPEAIATAIEALERLVGTVEKPRYVRFTPDRCVHRRQGVKGCDRCLSVCPAAAIRSATDVVEVDYYLCQGCGGCAAVCPTDAVSYAAPPLEHTTTRLRRMLETYRGAGGTRPRVVFHDQGTPPGAVSQEPGALPLALHSVAATGPETWLACLAWGAEEVLLAPSDEAPDKTLSLLEEQIELSGRLLAAVGQEPGRIRLVNDKVTSAKRRDSGLGELPLLDIAPSQGRRRLLLAALAALGDGRVLEERVTLPTGTAFGAVTVDEAGCTLCFACVNLCPTQALHRSQGDRSALLFTEGACVQCGICARACPEHAIQLAPGVLLEASRRESACRLAEGDAAHCASCGKPYLTRTLLAAALSHAKTSTLLQRDTGRLLELCPTCRAERVMRTELRPAIPGRRGDRGP